MSNTPSATHPNHWDRHGHPGQPCRPNGSCYGGTSTPQAYTPTEGVVELAKVLFEIDHMVWNRDYGRDMPVYWDEASNHDTWFEKAQTLIDTGALDALRAGR